MIFNTYGNPSATKKGLLLHAMAVDSRQFDTLRTFLEDDYLLILPVFDGHHEAGKTTFTSSVDQVMQITEYLEGQGIRELDFISGVSLGALVAFELYKLGRIADRHTSFLLTNNQNLCKLCMSFGT